ncbi:hypothetical protein [Kibdelosporangium philippinense]|uniref:hypothetical protein n=1 Tax=Kibdelosporangium philippinense TaxID=211113 RepID=UPI0036155125
MVSHLSSAVGCFVRDTSVASAPEEQDRSGVCVVAEFGSRGSRRAAVGGARHARQLGPIHPDTTGLPLRYARSVDRLDPEPPA